MKINISNMGPIKKADVEIRGLTVFIGPNNSGKSILATAMYAALSARPPRFMLNPIFRIPRINKTLKEYAEDDLEGLVKSGKVCDYSELSDGAVAIFKAALEDYFNAYLNVIVNEFERVYNGDLVSLRRAARTRLNFSCESISPEWKVSIGVTVKGVDKNISLPSLESAWRVMQERVEGSKASRINRNLATHVSRRGGQAESSFLAMEIAWELVRGCFREVPVKTKYLPAARSGLMQAHRALAASLIRSAATVGLREVSIPAMNGVVVDFLEDLLSIEEAPRAQHYQQHAEELEEEVLKGKIVSEGSNAGYPEFYYKVGSKRYPLASSSSMISEIAPVVMYLRNLVGPEDLLIVEEPEAHLHPSSQTAFAKVVAGLVNKGLKVAITTHSEYFLQQINNFILASSISQEAAESAGISKSYRLRPSQVSAYLFQPSDSGTDVTPLEVDSEEGISHGSFAFVEEHLYKQAVKIERAQ